jgi:hypothetical protein
MPKKKDGTERGIVIWKKTIGKIMIRRVVKRRVGLGGWGLCRF